MSRRARVELPFIFPYAEKAFREIYVYDNGMIGFGEPDDSNPLLLNNPLNIPFITGSHPTIALLLDRTSLQGSLTTALTVGGEPISNHELGGVNFSNSMDHKMRGGGAITVEHNRRNIKIRYTDLPTDFNGHTLSYTATLRADGSYNVNYGDITPGALESFSFFVGNLPGSDLTFSQLPSEVDFTSMMRKNNPNKTRNLDVDAIWYEYLSGNQVDLSGKRLVYKP